MVLDSPGGLQTFDHYWRMQFGDGGFAARLPHSGYPDVDRSFIPCLSGHVRTDLFPFSQIEHHDMIAVHGEAKLGDESGGKL